MGTIREIYDGIEYALTVIPGLRVHKFTPDRIEPPAAIMALPSTTYSVTLGEGVSRWEFPIWVLVAKADDKAAQDEMTDYLDAEGPKTVRGVLDFDRTLQGSCDTAKVINAEPKFATIAGTEYLAVEYTLEVYANG